MQPTLEDVWEDGSTGRSSGVNYANQSGSGMGAAEARGSAIELSARG